MLALLKKVYYSTIDIDKINSTHNKESVLETKKETKLVTKGMPSDSKKKWKVYRKKCWEMTNTQPISSLVNFEKRSFNGWHLDHKISIWYGFVNNIPHKIIGHISNLEMIESNENMKKGTKCNFKGCKPLQSSLFPLL